jgi:hypothetical protein
MFSKEIFELLKQVVTSWQTIAVTLAFVVYWQLVSYAARPHRARPAVKAKPKKLKRPPVEKPVIDKDVDTEDLGLGE